MDLTFDQGDTAKKTSQAIDEMKALTGDKGYYVGMAVQNKSPVSYTHLDVYKRQALMWR